MTPRQRLLTVLYDYYDNPAKYLEMAERRVEYSERYVHRLMKLEARPDFLCVGGSGTVVLQSVEVFRKIAFPAVKRVIELATQAGESATRFILVVPNGSWSGLSPRKSH